jgi:hypothetical protein
LKLLELVARVGDGGVDIGVPDARRHSSQAVALGNKIICLFCCFCVGKGEK